MTRPRLLTSEPDLSDSLDDFRKQLAETIAWCAPRADVHSPAGCLRSPRLAPRLFQRSYGGSVRDVALNRRVALAGHAVEFTGLAGGRLLVYGPDEELSDGAPETETSGYFDGSNCPPWDTWAAFIEEPTPTGQGAAAYLISWVPPVFVDLVERGIYVCFEQCIRWLDDSADPFAHYLAANLDSHLRREA